MAFRRGRTKPTGRRFELQEKLISIGDDYWITDDAGEVGGRDATVKKAMLGLRDRFHVEVEKDEDLTVKGNFVDHEYEVERDGDVIAVVSKKWARVRDTYGVEVFDAQRTALVLAVTVAVDALAHD